MTIDIQRDDLLTLANAAKIVPGATPNPHTLFRWHKYGCRGLHLETALVNGKLFTTEQAVFDFLNARNKQFQSNKGSKRRPSHSSSRRVLNQAKV